MSGPQSGIDATAAPDLIAPRGSARQVGRDATPESAGEVILLQVGGDESRYELVGRRRPGDEVWEYRCCPLNRSELEESSEEGDPSAAVWVRRWDKALRRVGVNAKLEVAVRPPQQARWEFSQAILAAASKRRARSRPASDPPTSGAPAGEPEWGVPADHPLAPWIARAYGHSEFATRWSDPTDQSFRALAALAFALHPDGPSPSAEGDGLIEQLCYRKRTEILKERVGTKAAGRLLRWLPRIEWTALTPEDWKGLSRIAGEEPDSSPLGHVREITPTLVRQFHSVPEKFRFPAFLEVVGRLDVPVERWERLQHILDQAGAKGQRALIHAARTVASIGEFWDFYFRPEGEDLPPFNLPDALQGSKLLEPLATPEAVKAEGRRMRNCLARLSTAVRDGRCVYFRPRDGTLVNAALYWNGVKWWPGEVLGARNGRVDNLVVARVRAELQRLATHLPSREAPAAGLSNTYLDRVRAEVRGQFSASEIQQLAEPLRIMWHRSRWLEHEADLLVFTAPVVSFQTTPHGKELLFEIPFDERGQDVDFQMTSEVVELIEQAGLKYRTCDRTFLRRFRFSSEQDRQAVAELTLALLARIFGHSPGMSFETRVYMPTYFTRAQVRRVAALAHTLWCEMIRLVERLRVIAQARDGDVRLEHTMALRTLQIFLKGYSAEHRLWTREYMPGGPLVYQVDLKWLLQEVCDVVTRPLDALDHEVWAASRRGGGREDLESKFSSGFCSTLTTLRGVFTDWNAVADVLTRVDFYWGQGRFDGPEDSHERLAAIAARMAQRTADAEAPQLRSRTRGARRSSARPG